MQYEMPQHLIQAIQDYQKVEEDINEQWIDAIEEFRKAQVDQPPIIQEAVTLLAEHGWYLDTDMTFSQLIFLRDQLNDTQLDNTVIYEALIQYFENKLQEIEKLVGENFPNRKKIIDDAFNAHRRQEYNLSIPVLLAQIDGICKEITGHYYFIRVKGGKKPQTAHYVDKEFIPSTKALLNPLADISTINKSQQERYKGFDGLNRHQVLHGESLDYGTKENSLKIISLLNYVVQVLKVLKSVE